MRKESVLTAILVFLLPPSILHSQGALQDSVAQLSNRIAQEMTENNKKTIAVIELCDLQGNVTNLGRFIAEELVTRLYQTKKFKVIERQLLAKVIREQKLSLTGLIDPNAARQLGNLLGVQAIVSGTMTDLAQNVRVNARLISTQSGEIFAVAATAILKDESVNKLLGASPNERGTSTVGLLPNVNPNPGNLFAVGNKFVVEGRLYEDRICKLSITSLEMLPGGILRVNIVHENRTDHIINVAAPGSKGESYIVDDLGDQYDLIESEEISNNGRNVPVGSLIRYGVLFKAPPLTSKSLSIVLHFASGEGWGIWKTIGFPKITLR
jgi:TolB-like protein